MWSWVRQSGSRSSSSGDRRGLWVLIKQWRLSGSWVLIEQWIPHGRTMEFGFRLVGLGWFGGGVVMVW